MMKLKKIPFNIFIKVLFSNKLIYTGLFIASITGILLTTFLLNMDPHDEKYITKEVVTCDGVLTDISPTNTSVNENKIYKYTFKYKLNGNSVHGFSFSEQIEKSISDSIQIEYIAENPEISRIVGTRNGAFKKDEILRMLLTFFSIGLFITLFTIYKKLIFIRTLKNGFEIVPAKLDSEIRFPSLPNAKSNPHYWLKFNYSKGNRQYKKGIFTQVSDFNIRRVRFSNILIDNENHNKGYVMELMPEGLLILIHDKSTIANTLQ